LTSELERIKILEKFEEEARVAAKLDESLKKYEKEREQIKGKIESIISQIDQLGI